MRSPLPDLLKGLAVYLMIQVHLAELFLKPELYSGITGQLALLLGGVPAAPVFMAVMGYFMARSGKSSWSVLKRGILLFAGGLLLNIGLNSSYFVFQWVNPDLMSAFTPWPYIFGVDILLFAGLATILLGLLKNLFKPKPIVWLVLAIAVVTFSSFFNQVIPVEQRMGYVAAFIGGGSFWSYFPLIPWLAYPLTGMAFAGFESSFKSMRNILRYSVLFTALLLFSWQFAYGFGISVQLHDYYHHGVRFYLWAVSGIILIASAAKWIVSVSGETLVMRYICWTGKNVTVFYVFQWLLIGNLSVIYYKSVGLMGFFVWFLAISVSSALLTFGFAYFKNRYRQRPGVI